jgi:integrase
LIAALRPEDRALWGCAFYAGLRRGELRALLWDDVDLADGLIRVERSMNSYGDGGEPKSRAGRRGVPIVAALRNHLVGTQARHGAT